MILGPCHSCFALFVVVESGNGLRESLFISQQRWNVHCSMWHMAAKPDLMLTVLGNAEHSNSAPQEMCALTVVMLPRGLLKTTQ